jgi:hypothetical protein
MASNLFEAFDAAFMPRARRSLGDSVAARIAAWRARLRAMREARRRRRLARDVMILPPHLLKDIGYVAWDGRLWRMPEAAEPWPRGR